MKNKLINFILEKFDLVKKSELDNAIKEHEDFIHACNNFSNVHLKSVVDKSVIVTSREYFYDVECPVYCAPWAIGNTIYLATEGKKDDPIPDE